MVLTTNYFGKANVYSTQGARLGIITTSAIQRINGVSLKEHWAAQRNQL